MPDSNHPAGREPVTAADSALEFERLLADIAASFIDLPIGRIDEAFDDALRRTIVTLGVDRCTLSIADPRTGQFRSLHSQAAPGFRPVPSTVSSRTFPWALARFRAGLPVMFARLADLPPEAARDAASYASIDLRAHVGMPVMVSGEFVAVLGFASLQCERAWPDALVARMRLLADLFGSALARKRTQDRIDELLRFERLLAEWSTTLAGAPRAALDDEVGAALRSVAAFVGADRVRLWSLTPGARLVATHGWLGDDLAAVPEILDAERLPWTVGRVVAGEIVNVPSVADLAATAAADAAAYGAACLQSLLVVPLRLHRDVAGAMSLATVHEARSWPAEYAPRLALFGALLAGALALRDSEEAARRAAGNAAHARERLAHFARVEAVGAMSAAIAHEINQPLAAIGNYASAAARRLAGPGPVDSARLGEILAKISGQATLAGDVLDRLRSLVRRRHASEARIDVARLIRDVLHLVDIESRLADVRVETELAPELLPVFGDAIQVQQVIMNLAHNAMEAMSTVRLDERVLRIEAAASGDRQILVRVVDRGPGVAQAERERLFEPFHTTKSTGLGIGLSICRDIVEAHGGKLWYEPDPAGGAVFQFTLPGASGGE